MYLYLYILQSQIEQHPSSVCIVLKNNVASKVNFDTKNDRAKTCLIVDHCCRDDVELSGLQVCSVCSVSFSPSTFHFGPAS